MLSLDLVSVFDPTDTLIVGSEPRRPCDAILKFFDKSCVVEKHELGSFGNKCCIAELIPTVNIAVLTAHVIL